MTFSAKFIIDLLEFAKKQGFDVDSVYDFAQIQKKELEDETARIDATTVSKVFQKIVEITHNEDIGLHLGEMFFLNATKPVYLVMQNSNDVLEAFENGVKYSGLVATVLDNKLEISRNTFSVVFEPHPEWLNEMDIAVKCTYDVTTVCVLKSLQLLTNSNHFPVSVEFSMKLPNDVNEYYRIFNCPVKFDCNQTSITFDKTHLQYIINGKDAEILGFLKQYANEKLATLSKQEDTMVKKVKRIVYKFARPIFPTIEQVANDLNINSRTLQRRLGEENAAYKDLIEQIRKELCQNYLAKGNHSIGDISYLLGYSEPSAFIKAFKRWHGISPKKYFRDQNLSN